MLVQPFLQLCGMTGGVKRVGTALADGLGAGGLPPSSSLARQLDGLRDGSATASADRFAKTPKSASGKLALIQRAEVRDLAKLAPTPSPFTHSPLPTTRPLPLQENLAKLDPLRALEESDFGPLLVKWGFKQSESGAAADAAALADAAGPADAWAEQGMKGELKALGEQLRAVQVQLAALSGSGAPSAADHLGVAQGGSAAPSFIAYNQSNLRATEHLGALPSSSSGPTSAASISGAQPSSSSRPMSAGRHLEVMPSSSGPAASAASRLGSLPSASGPVSLAQQSLALPSSSGLTDHLMALRATGK